MKKDIKSSVTYKTIGQTAKELNLIDDKTGRVQTHTLRFWESQFKQIKPTIKAGKRRYYSEKNFKMIQYIKFLLKDRGLTINGAKKVLEQRKVDSLDVNKFIGINSQNLNISNDIKGKIKNISKIVKQLKKFK